MGPDEFHERYPGAAEGGLRNNAYTNVMAAWICRDRAEGARAPPGRAAATPCGHGSASPTRRSARWQEISRKMFVPFHGDGIISQFEGYEDLEELDWEAYRATHGNIQRLDRILRAEGDDPRPLQAGQAGRHADAVLPVPRRRAAAALRAARLRVLARHRPQDHRVLRPADLPRVDAELRSSTPASWPASIPRARGSGSWSRSRATSATSRAARPRRASTWA